MNNKQLIKEIKNYRVYLKNSEWLKCSDDLKHIINWNILSTNDSCKYTYRRYLSKSWWWHTRPAHPVPFIIFHLFLVPTSFLPVVLFLHPTKYLHTFNHRLLLQHLGNWSFWTFSRQFSLVKHFPLFSFYLDLYIFIERKVTAAVISRNFTITIMYKV